MTDRQIDFLVAHSDPLGARGLDEDLLAAPAAELRESIAAHAPDPGRRAGGSRARLARRAVAVGLVAAAGLGAATLAGVGRFGDGAQPAWGAAVLRAAESSPRMLIGEDGWTISRADELGVSFGETVFAKGGERMQLDWYPAAGRPVEAPGAGSGTTAVAPTTLGGATVVIARYDGSDRYRAAWRVGDWTLELDGDAASPARFTEILQTLRAAGVDEWLSAMPASTVSPAGRAEVVDAMLEGLPVPPGLDLRPLREGTGTVRDRYQLGADVSGTVACAWIGRWVDARAAGDAAGARRAVAAMATSRRWAVLQEMNAAGDYPEVVWQIAGAMAGDGTVPGGKAGMTVAGTYRAALGCARP